LPALRPAGDGNRSIERILLRAVDAAGGIGFGEVAPWPGFPTESLEEAAAVLESAGGNLGRLRRASEEGALPCLGAALSMVSAWDQAAAFAGEMACAGLLGEGEGEARAAELAARGYVTLKAKLRPGDNPDRFRTILAATPAELRLRLDANGRLDLTEALVLMDWARGEPRIEFVEQPLAAGDPGYAALGPSKVALDESFLCGPRRAPETEGWEGFLVVKPAMAGDWKSLRELLRAHPPERLIMSSAFETAVGFQAGLAFAAALGTTRAVGFGTLGSDPKWERHSPGPFAAGRTNIDWEALWASAA
jgi:O-succinylbenzoate synthase